MRDFTPSKNPGLLSATLRTIYLDRKALAIGLVYKDSAWEIQADLFLTQYLKEHPIAKVVASLQIYSNGEHVAVCRLHRELT